MSIQFYFLTGTCKGFLIENVLCDVRLTYLVVDTWYCKYFCNNSKKHVTTRHFMGKTNFKKFKGKIMSC